MKKRLEAVATTGKTKFIEIEAKDEYLITRWGYVDGKVQETKEKCEAKNVGKKNFISAKEQAVIRLKRKIKKKMDKGYIVPGSTVVVDKEPNLSTLQKYFTLCKPIAKPPKDAFNGSYLAERKFNGVNIILVKDKNGQCKSYTRRMDDITKNLEFIPTIIDKFDYMPNGSMMLTELVYFVWTKWPKKKEAPEFLRGIINKNRSVEDVKIRYKEMTKQINQKGRMFQGEVFAVGFDVMFWDGKFVGDLAFTERRKLFGNTVLAPFTKQLTEEKKKLGWEGFILRKPDGQITYTMNGKAKRFGSWKWKYEITDDFIVVGAEYGKGKHDRYFSRFKLAQYNKDGDLVDCGYCGPGNLKVAELEDLHKDRKATDGTYKVKPYMVIEVLFRARASGGVKLEFPVFKRIRDDKKSTECIFNG